MLVRTQDRGRASGCIKVYQHLNNKCAIYSSHSSSHDDNDNDNNSCKRRHRHLSNKLCNIIHSLNNLITSILLYSLILRTPIEMSYDRNRCSHVAVLFTYTTMCALYEKMYVHSIWFGFEMYAHYKVLCPAILYMNLWNHDDGRLITSSHFSSCKIVKSTSATEREKTTIKICAI